MQFFSLSVNKRKNPNQKNCSESGILLKIRFMAVYLYIHEKECSYIFFSFVLVDKLSHWDQYSCNIVEGRGKGAFGVCYTEHTRDTHELVQAAHPEVAQVCTGVQVTVRTSLFAPLAPSLQKLSSLCYLINVTLVALNWHGNKSWEVWGTPEQFHLQ